MPAFPEDGKEVFEIQCVDACNLELEQGVLTRIGIDREYVLRPCQSVVQCIASGTGNDENSVLWAEIESLPVNRRVFPASVVDQ